MIQCGLQTFLFRRYYCDIHRRNNVALYRIIMVLRVFIYFSAYSRFIFCKGMACNFYTMRYILPLQGNVSFTYVTKKKSRNIESSHISTSEDISYISMCIYEIFCCTKILKTKCVHCEILRIGTL